MPKVLVVSLLALFALCPLWAQAAQLPELNWEKRSDWLDPTTDTTPRAVGNGVADDTAALQAALDRISNESKTNKVVFLPKGIYRITKTLVISNTSQGAEVIGCGRNTRIVWDGEDNGIMLMSNGAGRHNWVGITWDGRGKAGVGVDHRSEKVYETRVRHEHEAFLNFRISGIRVGFQQKLASAEMLYLNCLFDHCENGVSFLSWNDYDNLFSNCLFRDCGVGIYCERGNYVVRCSNFERSRRSDMIASTHSYSVRRCYSTDSAMFITTAGSGRSNCEWMIEDCRVTGWKNPDGAIQNGFTSPMVIIDTVFAKPPSPKPPIQMTNNAQIHGIVTSNCQSPDTNGLIATNTPAHVIEVPKGKRGGNLPADPIIFFSETASIPGKVFDAKRDFGAKGNGVTDDTDAIQRAILAAKAYGHNAIAYLPYGTYKVTRSLIIDGGDYTVGGTGFYCVLQYAGAQSPVLAVRDPQQVTLEQFRIEVPEDKIPTVAKIQQTSSGKGSSIVYDGVWVGGSWRIGKPALRGVEMANLGKNDRVRFKHLDGSVRLTDCSAATIYADLHLDGKFVVEGTKPIEPGFLGTWCRFCSGNDFDFEIHDNHSFIVADYYTEQTMASLLADGGATTRNARGRVTFHCAKVGWENLATNPRGEKGDGIHLRNYYGQFFGCGGQFLYQSPTVVTQTGDRPIDIVFAGNAFCKVPPLFNITPASRLTLLENSITLENFGFVPNQMPDPQLKATSNAFDHFRDFGAMDLEMNRKY